jgi:hypothetical protein
MVEQKECHDFSAKENLPGYEIVIESKFKKPFEWIQYFNKKKENGELINYHTFHINRKKEVIFYISLPI